jgi:5'-3' exonuclease
MAQIEEDLEQEEQEELLYEVLKKFNEFIQKFNDELKEDCKADTIDIKYLKQKYPHLKRTNKDLKKKIKNNKFDEINPPYIYEFLTIYDTSNIFSQDEKAIINNYCINKITPIFIFDGKPPEEKKKLLNDRYLKKIESEKEYKELEKSLEKEAKIENNEIQQKMDSLKKKCIFIKKEQTNLIKELISSKGGIYIQYTNEADELCAWLTKEKKVWGCLSEDMDLFVYGCSRVYRSLNLLNDTVVCYQTKSILNTLNVTLEEFKEICVLSGTDYSSELLKSHSLYQTYQYFQEYKKDKIQNFLYIDFYPWLQKKHPEYIKNIEDLLNIKKMFDLSFDKNYLEMVGTMQNIGWE